MVQGTSAVEYTEEKEGVIKKKPLTIATILSGIPAPVDRINQLTDDVEREMADIEAKKNDAPKISTNTQKLKEKYMSELSMKIKKPALDLSILRAKNSLTKRDRLSFNLKAWKFDYSKNIKIN